LGTGSTAAFAVDRIGQLMKEGSLKDIVAVPTSIATKNQAEKLGIPLATLDTVPVLDVAIDGSDEVDPDLNLVKGRGGALLREKMVELASKKFVCIVDDSKMVSGLGGSKLAMPVEVTPFCYEYNMKRLPQLPEVKGCTAKVRSRSLCAICVGAAADIARFHSSSSQLRMKEKEIYVTDNGNYIVDLYFETPMKDAVAAGNAISGLVGVVEHGLFLNMCDVCIIAGKDGISIKERKLNRA
jgi:ribose 5-phosphate isomerase A